MTIHIDKNMNWERGTSERGNKDTHEHGENIHTNININKHVNINIT